MNVIPRDTELEFLDKRATCHCHHLLEGSVSYHRNSGTGFPTQAQAQDQSLTQFRTWVIMTRQPIYTNIKRGFILDLCFGLRGPLLFSVSIFNELFFRPIFKGSFTDSTQCLSHGFELRRIHCPFKCIKSKLLQSEEISDESFHPSAIATWKLTLMSLCASGNREFEIFPLPSTNESYISHKK